MISKEYTKELNKIIRYMEGTLAREFPTNMLTIEYFFTSIIDNRKCNANLLLTFFLKERGINELNAIFNGYLRDNSTPYFALKNKRIYSTTLGKLFEDAKKEMVLLNDEELGTEHLLLALLKHDYNNEKMFTILERIGVKYEDVFSICGKKNKLNDRLNKLKMQPIPLKSEINQQTLINKTTYIDSYTIDINKQAEDGKIDKLIGREKEITKILNVLARRKKNNVVLVGQSGCGKTALVQGLALKIVNNEVPEMLKNKKIIQLNVASLIAGTYLRGAFEERIKGLFDEMKTSNKYILFIDDIHTVLKSTSKEKDTDISALINEVLSGGDIKVIGATSFKDYRNTIEINTMISRRLQKIIVEPTTVEETIEIIKQNKHYYEKHHNVTYSDEAIVSCVKLSDRYITDRSLPDSAIDVIDFSGAHTCMINRKPSEIADIEEKLENLNTIKTNMLNNGDFEGVESIIPEENSLKTKLADLQRNYEANIDDYKILITPKEIAESVSEITNIPMTQLNTDDKKRLSQINDILKKSIIGQDDAIDKICRSIKRNKIGLGNSNRVIFSGLLVGSSGCGKTLLAKKLAEEIYGSKNALVRIDMSEYSEKNSVAKLTGAAPGYIGYDNGGVLDIIKNKPYCVLLLDEIEKADKEVFNLFLQIFDEGRLTDSSGALINFKNVVVLMTSNVGAKMAQDFSGGIGFVENKEENSKSIIEKEIKNKFSPEFLNRLDNIIHFNNLTFENLISISKLEIDKVVERINGLGYSTTYDDDVIEYVANECKKESEYGARPIGRYLQTHVEDVITDMILNDDELQKFHVYINDDKLKII